MEEILHQVIGGLSHYLQEFIHPSWCRISSINSMFCLLPFAIPTREENFHGWKESQDQGEGGGFPQQPWVFLRKMIMTWGGDWRLFQF